MYVVDFYIGKTRNRNDEKIPLYKKQRNSYTRSNNRKVLPHTSHKLERLGAFELHITRVWPL